MLGLGFGLAGVAARGGVDPVAAVLWDFTNPAGPLPGFSLTRSSAGTYVDAAGVIQSAAINQARFDWTGGVRALLVEPSATNLLPASDSFPGWTLLGVTVSADSSPDPSTGNSADTLISSAGVGNKRAQLPVTYTAGVTQTISCWIKRGTTNAALYVHNGSGGGSAAYAKFDLSSGVVSGVQNSSASISQSILGWYRCTMTFTYPAGWSSAFACVGIWDGSPDGSGLPVCSAAGLSIMAWGAQLENGSQATSGIRTSGAAVTRAADSLASLSMSAIWAAAGSVQGTIVVDVEAGAPNSTSRSYLWNISDSGSNIFNLRSSVGGTTVDLSQLTVGDGTTNVDLLIASPLRGRQKIAVSYANGAQPMVSRNGGVAQVHPLVYAHNPDNTALQSLFAGFNGRVRSLAVYRNVVNAAQLTAMSAVA